MQKKIFILTIILHIISSYTHTHQYLPLSQFGEPEYQDIFVNGKILTHGQRLCQERYEALKPILNSLNRPFKVLDLGASQGYFSFRIGYDYPHSCCTMIEGNFKFSQHVADQLEVLCKANDSLSNIIYLKKYLSAEDLEELSKQEHFDIVLAFSILHHFDKDWKRATDAILSLGDNVIIETPPSNDPLAKSNWTIPYIEKYLLEKEQTVIAEIPRNPSTILAKMFWFQFSEHKQRYNGINLSTFHLFNGTYPDKNFIEKKITQLKQPINLITITGLNLQIKENK